MRNVMFACLLGVLGQSPAFAQSAAAPAAETTIRDMDVVVVSGVQPGPGMWKVSKGDHVMWVLGTLSPLPKRMEWESRDVESVLAQAQEVLYAPRIGFTADVGFFGKLALLPSLYGLRKNPDGVTLQELVPADVYAHWEVLKQRYIGRDRGVEKLRPMFAAFELYEEAIDKSGLVQSGVIGPVIEDAIKRHQIKTTRPEFPVAVKEPKAALKQLRTERLSDLDCFGKTLQYLERDLGRMTGRANAWASGDIDTLRNLPMGDQNEACEQAWMQASVVRKLGPADIEAELTKLWLDAADKALATNRVTFATLPMRELLKSDGYLARLAAKGYVIEPPQTI